MLTLELLAVGDSVQYTDSYFHQVLAWYRPRDAVKVFTRVDSARG